ncbi:hypothetical protein [Enterococcus faecalis]|uniref:hypothetical protein n=1 Tax=Enterococcus faecalis TaxID=1351 RepID=UPI000330815A|nr:hypothetical protein [Enterococcus faecalis]EOJ64979.1 hypothetical protein WMM_00422 [Enterococcus faecalis EnGen0364]
MSYITKKMVVDLTEHMKKHRKKKILVEDYIRETGHDKEWTKQRKQTLYKSIHETEALFMDYCLVAKSENEPQKWYMRVSLL